MPLPCGMSAACVLICCELLEIHAGVVGPDVPCVPVELHVNPKQAIVASVLENLMFRPLVLCLHPCLVHVNLHVYCTVAPIEEIDVAAGCPLGNVPRIQLHRGHNECVEVLCPASSEDAHGSPEPSRLAYNTARTPDLSGIVRARRGLFSPHRDMLAEEATSVDLVGAAPEMIEAALSSPVTTAMVSDPSLLGEEDQGAQHFFLPEGNTSEEEETSEGRNTMYSTSGLLAQPWMCFSSPFSVQDVNSSNVIAMYIMLVLFWMVSMWIPSNVRKGCFPVMFSSV